jgi:uncharacterized membrane protein
MPWVADFPPSVEGEKMQRNASTLKTNIIYGLITLIPISIVFLVLAKMVEILEAIADSLGIDSVVGVVLAIVLTLVLFIGLCFGVGALVRTRIGSLSMDKLEQKVFNQIPGYKIANNILKGFLRQERAYHPAMIQLNAEGSAALGFVMEENQNGTMTVFVPASPAITTGRVYVVADDRVCVLDISAMEFIDSLSQWGIGMGKLLTRNESNKNA